MPKQTTAAAKKTPAKKPVAKKPVAKKAPRKAAKAARPEMQSFRLAPQDAFLTLQVTRQTLYWAIIAVLVVGLAAWVLALQLQIMDIYDSIERNQALLD